MTFKKTISLLFFFQKYVSEGSIVRDCVPTCVEKGEYLEFSIFTYIPKSICYPHLQIYKQKKKKNLCHISPFSLLSFCSSKNISSITGNAENMLQNIRKMNFNRTNNLKYVLSCVFRELSILKLFPRKILHCVKSSEMHVLARI